MESKLKEQCFTALFLITRRIIEYEKIHYIFKDIINWSRIQRANFKSLQLCRVVRVPTRKSYNNRRERVGYQTYRYLLYEKKFVFLFWYICLNVHSILFPTKHSIWNINCRHVIIFFFFTSFHGTFWGNASIIFRRKSEFITWRARCHSKVRADE